MALGDRLDDGQSEAAAASGLAAPPEPTRGEGALFLAQAKAEVEDVELHSPVGARCDAEFDRRTGGRRAHRVLEQIAQDRHEQRLRNMHAARWWKRFIAK
jgi:hypothetical protein